MTAKRSIIPVERIEHRILLIRGQKVILDTDLAILYGVSTKRLNEQVKRNRGRFPPDFMFELTIRQKQEVVAKCDHLKRLKFSPTRPWAFTEHGAIMAATVLNSARAVEASVYVVRVFVKLREMLANHKVLAHKLNELERKIANHDEQIQALIVAIRELMTPPVESRKRRPIGYLTNRKTGDETQPESNENVGRSIAGRAARQRRAVGSELLRLVVPQVQRTWATHCDHLGISIQIPR